MGGEADADADEGCDVVGQVGQAHDGVAEDTVMAGLGCGGLPPIEMVRTGQVKQSEPC